MMPMRSAVKCEVDDQRDVLFLRNSRCKIARPPSARRRRARSLFGRRPSSVRMTRTPSVRVLVYSSRDREPRLSKNRAILARSTLTNAGESDDPPDLKSPVVQLQLHHSTPPRRRRRPSLLILDTMADDEIEVFNWVAEPLDDPPVAIMIDHDGEDDFRDDEGLFLGAAIGVPANVQAALLDGRPADSISPLLFDMVKVGYTCTSLLSGWSTPHDQCTKRVEQCQERPEEAWYVCSRTSRSPLHEACLRNGCIHVIRALLAATEVSPAFRDSHGNTPLHLLFVSHSPMSRSPQEMDSIVEALLENHSAVVAAATNREGNTPLHMACSAEPNYVSPAVLTRILAANPACASTPNNLNRLPLHVYCMQPTTRTSIEIAQILLDAHRDAAHLLDGAGRTPLHHAAIKTNTHLVCFLLNTAPQAALIRSGPQQQTPLHVFCQQKPREQHVPALRALLEAAPETVTLPDGQLSSPLHVVCKSKKPLLQVIRLLIDTDPGVASMTDSEGYTALHYACENEAESEVIECLLAAYSGAASVVSRKQDTALHVACSANSCSETVKLLIQANPEALTMTNDYGFTPLHCVCRAYVPRAGIVQAIVQASPECVAMRTHGGETAMHLACSSGAYVGVLKLLADSQSDGLLVGDSRLAKNQAMTNKIGNTPLHEACFRGAGYERIETLAKSNPGWIMSRNNAGYTPLQILCKGGLLDVRVVTSFARIGGPEVFSVVDETGHTPLHSACRDGTDIAAIQSLIRAYPGALQLKTTYGDTPLHLAVLRRANVDVVRLIAESSTDQRYSPLFEQNGAGQTAIGIAIEAFQLACRGRSGCCVEANPLRVDQVYVFDVLAMLIKLLFYGTSSEEDCHNLVRACVSIHRQDVRLDPAFIRRAIALHPEDVKSVDDEGNYPLHVEASIPIEKMSLLDSPIPGCCSGNCHTRIGILEMLIEAYPEALCVHNSNDEFPLGLMIRNGRTWSHAFALALRTFPAALHWYHGGVSDGVVPLILEKVSKHCGPDTLYQLLVTRPSVLATRRQINVP